MKTEGIYCDVEDCQKVISKQDDTRHAYITINGSSSSQISFGVYGSGNSEYHICFECWQDIMDEFSIGVYQWEEFPEFMEEG
jgi:hypothetical protein